MGIGSGDDVDITPLEGTKVDGLGGGDTGLGAALEVLDVLDMSSSHSQQGQESQKTHCGGSERRDGCESGLRVQTTEEKKRKKGKRKQRLKQVRIYKKYYEDMGTMVSVGMEGEGCRANGKAGCMY